MSKSISPTYSKQLKRFFPRPGENRTAKRAIRAHLRWGSPCCGESAAGATHRRSALGHLGVDLQWKDLPECVPCMCKIGNPAHWDFHRQTLVFKWEMMIDGFLTVSYHGLMMGIWWVNNGNRMTIWYFVNVANPNTQTPPVKCGKEIDKTSPNRVVYRVYQTNGIPKSISNGLVYTLESLWKSPVFSLAQNVGPVDFPETKSGIEETLETWKWWGSKLWPGIG